MLSDLPPAVAVRALIRAVHEVCWRIQRVSWLTSGVDQTPDTYESPVIFVWQVVDKRNYVAKSRDQLSERITAGILWTLENPKTVKSMCTIKTEL